MTDTILCIDIGTSSLKAALLPDNLRKSEIFVSRQSFPESAFKNHDSARHYLPALKAAVSELKEKCPDYAIEAICISGNGPTLISDDCTTLLYSDIFSAEGKEKSLGLREEALRKTKSLFIPRLTRFKMIFGDSWKKAGHIFGSPEFLLYELTGNAVTILPEERFLTAYWTETELKDCGFQDSEIKKLPGFVSSGSFVGKINQSAAIETGLLEGTFVFAGAPDFVVALIGTGTIFPGRLCNRGGTSEGLNLCTSKPIFAEELRTLPSAIPGLWNLSYLMKNDAQKDNGNGKNPEYEKELSHAVDLLRKAALSNGESFPGTMAITGGQALDGELVAQKERATGLTIKKMPCSDAELIGDLILARVSIGDYDDIMEAVFAILGA